MKKCGYCSRENVDEAIECVECGTRFVGQPEAERFPSIWEGLKQPISARSKGLLWCAAWFVAFVAVKPANFWAAPFFPPGLLGVLPWINKAVAKFNAWPLLVVTGWAIYCAVTAGIDRTRKRGTFFLMYLVLCILLALNVVGCRTALDELSDLVL